MNGLEMHEVKDRKKRRSMVRVWLSGTDIVPPPSVCQAPEHPYILSK